MANQENEIFLRGNGETEKRDCFSCQIISGERRQSENHIYTTTHFDAHQDYQIPIPGMVIIAAKEHRSSLDEFTSEQRYEYVDLVAKMAKGIKDVLGASAIYYFQREDTTHHFHTWLFPRYAWMGQFGTGIGSVDEIIKDAKATRNTPKGIEEVNSATQQLKLYVATN